MKKFYLICTAVMAMFATTAQADRILFTENYEVGGVPATWTINGGTGSIAGDSEGKYFSFALGSSNGRSANCFWGESIFDPVKEGLTEYSVYVEFQFQAFGNNQYNGEFAIFSGEGCASSNGSGTDFAGDNKGVWAHYSALTPNTLFSLAQNSAEISAMETKDPTVWFINGDSTDVFNPTAGTWYALSLNVNVATGEVAYSLEDFDGTVSKKGSKTLAEGASNLASGIFLMDARYQSVINVDNIKVTIPGDYANNPVIALTGLNMEERTYTISFLEGETLHVVNTDGTEATVGYFDSETPGTYVVKTTTSGTLKAYTTVGELISETVEQEVTCEAIVLPAPTYAIVSAEEGYAKTYQFTIDNSAVEMNPEIFMDFAFKSDNGTDDFVLENQNTGASVNVPSKGILTITTKAIGYSNGSSTVENDTEYEALYDIDFQHMTGEALTEKGFVKLENINEAAMGGEHDWTARMRMYLQIATGEKDDEGNDVYALYPVYGPDEKANGGTIRGEEKTGKEILDGYKNANGWTLDGRTYASIETGETIERYLIEPSNLTEEKAHSLFAPLYTWNTASDGSDVAAVKINIGIGLINVGNVGDGQTGKMANNFALGVDGLTDDELIVVSKINGYGAGSIHPQFPAGTEFSAAKEEYKAMHLGGISEIYKGTQTFNLYRIDTALNRVVVLALKGSTAIQTVGMQTVSDKNAPVYNLNGVQMSGALKKGVYIKQGKKFVVK